MINYIYAEKFFKNNIHKRFSVVGSNFAFDNEEIVEESVEVKEPFNTSQNLVFGSVETGSITLKTVNTHCAIGTDVAVLIYLDGDTENPFTLGEYTVTNNTLSDDRLFRTVELKDALYKVINADVTAWYNSLTFPMTLSTFRGLFFNYFNILQESVTLANDSMPVYKTIEGEISGKKILSAILEINGCIGHMGRDNVFKYVIPSSQVDYSITASKYAEIKYADYNCQPITKLQIRQAEDDIGVIVGSGDNEYIVEGNFLVFGLGSEELSTIANNLLTTISGITAYKPCQISMPAFPCLEVGDRLQVTHANGTFETLVMGRTFKGITQLADVIKATGDYKRIQAINGIHSDIKQLRGKSNELTRSIEETRSTITDVAEGLHTEIVQTAAGIEVEIEDLQSQIDGEIEYYEREGAPTKLNYPYWDFTRSIPCNNTIRLAEIYDANMLEGGDQYPHFTYTEEDEKLHLRDLVFDTENVVSYRFNKLGEHTYDWQQIEDTETAVILAQIAELRATAEELSSEYTEISLDLEDNYWTKTETQSKITQSANSIRTEVSSTYQPLSGMSSYATKSYVEQTASSITSTVSQTYATKSTTNSLQSQINQQAGLISGKVSKSGGASSSFAYELYDDRFRLVANNSEVFLCNSSGVKVTGQITATSGKIGNWNISGGAIVNGNIYIQSDGNIVGYRNGTAMWALMQDGSAFFHGNVDISGYATSQSVAANYATINSLNAVDAKFGSLNASNITSGTLNASRIGAGTIEASKLKATNGYFALGNMVFSVATVQVQNLQVYYNNTYHQVRVENGYLKV